jgi:hypothetical protein
MIFRRIKAHIENENWFAVLIDFLIVVVGVFIGIQVANWNASRENERIADEYIERLQAEILIDNQASQNVFDYLSTVRTYGISALNAFKHPTQELSSAFLIDLYQASQTWNYQPNLSTYNELLATGRISLISDENSRKTLSGYFLGRRGSAKTIEKSMNTSYRSTIRSYMDNDIQMKIRETCGDTYSRTESNATTLQLPKSCDLTISDDLALTEIKQLHANAIVRRELTFHLGEIDVALSSLKNDINAGNTTLSILEGTTP